MVSRKNYDQIAVDAAHSVLLELARVLDILPTYFSSISILSFVLCTDIIYQQRQCF
jgi:hypothetical protein